MGRRGGVWGGWGEGSVIKVCKNTVCVCADQGQQRLETHIPVRVVDNKSPKGGKDLKEPPCWHCCQGGIHGFYIVRGDGQQCTRHHERIVTPIAARVRGAGG